MTADAPEHSGAAIPQEPAEQRLTRERDRLQLLLDVNNSIASYLDLRDLFKAISRCLRQVIHHNAAALTLYDPDSGQLRIHTLDVERALGSVVEGELLPIEGNPTGLAFASRKPMVIRRFDPSQFTAPVAQRAYADGIRSGCVVPLILHDQALGTLTVVSLREEAFNEEDAELLTQVAGQVAIAVANALNFEQACAAQQRYLRERDRTQLLLDITNAIASHLDLTELIKAVSASLSQVMEHDFVGVALYDAEAKELRSHVFDATRPLGFFHQGLPVPLDGTPGGLAFTSGKTVLVRRLDTEQFPTEFARKMIEGGVRSGISAPLIVHGRTLGSMGVVSLREDAFSEDDAELFTQIAGQIAIAIENALVYKEVETLKDKLASEKLYLEEEILTTFNFEEIIGQSAALRRILQQVETAAPTGSTILIQGETGTGKELIARAIHNLSDRRERTLVKVNCAAIPTGLLESEFFGHEKGAFTGAIAQRIGRFELAHRGTLFLDEVGDIPLDLQPKLLRVLQEQEFERLGSPRTIRVDVRLVAATNCDLAQLVAEKKYRSDLFYRLNVFPIHIPSLRERPEDIPLLARFFAHKFARRMKKRIESIPATAQDALLSYNWPGNVRELENFIERAVILTKGTELEIHTHDLKPTKESPARSAATLENAEREHILRALQESNWVIGGENGAASRLGMKRTTLQSRIQKLGITRPS